MEVFDACVENRCSVKCVLVFYILPAYCPSLVALMITTPFVSTPIGCLLPLMITGAKNGENPIYLAPSVALNSICQ
jgi:hypothetical protein